jgi:hypothetical protein
MIEYISLRYDNDHTHCTLCDIDCFHKTFFLKECGHSFCMKCVSVYFDRIKTDTNAICPACISITPITPLLKEALDHRESHEPPQGRTEEVFPLP